MTKKLDRRVVLGVDLDEVTFGYLEGFRRWLRTKNIAVPAEEPQFYDLAHSGWFTSPEEFLKLHGEAVEEGFYEQLELLPGAHHQLQSLSHAGYEINIITSRLVNPGQHRKAVSQTVAALDAHGIPYRAISFLSDKTLHYADAYLDDSPRNLENLGAAGRYTIAFDLAYNRGVEASARVSSWDEAREVLRKRFGA